MAFSLTSPFTGASQTGFTTPTYDYVADIAPDVNGEQIAIDTLGGTQDGVDVHSVARPFTVTVFKPKTFKSLGVVNPVTGALPNVPRNVYKLNTRKGVTPLSGQPSVTMLIETIIHVPAGADIADPANVHAAMSAHIGALWDSSTGLGDTLITGVL